MSPIDGRSKVCQWISISEAFEHFATYAGTTQSQEHIKPIHWYVACRLVVEGGLRPDDVWPHPPFEAIRRGQRWVLRYAPEKANNFERTLLGGLKTKDVDVVVTKEGIGPVIAVSCKGMTGALRNLTNRMEETVGECTNLHITYPALVFGYLFLIRANRRAALGADLAGAGTEGASAARQLAANDIALELGGEPVEAIIRFNRALSELHGRQGIRSDVSRYEAISLVLIDMAGNRIGQQMASFPPPESPLRFEQFFQTLYLQYDQRFVYAAPSLKAITERLEWSAESPAFAAPSLPPQLDYHPRTS